MGERGASTRYGGAHTRVSNNVPEGRADTRRRRLPEHRASGVGAHQARLPSSAGETHPVGVGQHRAGFAFGAKSLVSAALQGRVIETTRMRHIGILAHSADGAALCFLEIVREASRRLGAHRHPEITLSILPMGPMLEQVRTQRALGCPGPPRAHGSAARGRWVRLLRVPRQHGPYRARTAR